MIKTKLHRYFKVKPNADLKTALETLVKVYNNSPNHFDFVPSQADTGELDPLIRSKMYPHRTSLTPFIHFYKSQSLLQKKTREPNPKALEYNLESEDSYRVGDFVFVNFASSKFEKTYDVKRARVYQVLDFRYSLGLNNF